MFILHLNIRPETEKRLKKILEYTEDQEFFVQKIIAGQIAELKNGIFHIRVQLKQFEEKYKMPSKEFYCQYRKCVFRDRDDFLRWAEQYENLIENERRLSKLK